MGIYTHLHKEHEDVKAIMNEILALGNDDSSQKKTLFRDLKNKLISHAKSEEIAFYNQIKGYPELCDKIEHAEQEHEEAESLLDELSDTELVGAAWQQKFIKLKEDVEHHIAEEENSVFYLANKRLDQEDSDKCEAEMKEVENELVS